MMSQQEQLTQFIRQIMEDVNREAGELLKDAEKSRQSALADAENRLLSEVFRKIQASAAEIKSEAGRRVAGHILSLRKEEAARRLKIKEEVLDEVAQRVAAFTKTDGYQTALLSQAHEAAGHFEEGPVTVILRAEDLMYQSLLAPFFPMGAVFAAGPIALGGLIVEGSQRRIIVDLSFDAKLSEMNEQFSLYVHLDAEHCLVKGDRTQ